MKANQVTILENLNLILIYLDEVRMTRSAEFDVLAFWKEISRRSPNLARMACDILSIPTTTVASGSVFSIGARVVNKYRSSMKDESTTIKKNFNKQIS